ncbi:MAG: acyltransferase family protein [Muribaculaceae bacterium]|nr:acyltransferase family protein [Muribaculaceae bacterium]
MNNNRILWADYAKAFAIFSVVLLHVHCNEVLDKCINGYIMPLFFIISGYLFSYERNPGFKPFVLKRARQILVPYVWINAVAYVAWLTVLRHYGDDAASCTQWYSPLVGILAGIPHMLVHDIPTWSLLSFFVVETVYYVLRRHVGNGRILTAVLLITFIGLSHVFEDKMSVLPLALGPSLAGLLFYSAGHELRESGVRAGAVFRGPVWPVSGIAFIISVCCNSYVEFYICSYGNIILFLASSVSGAVFVISTCVRLSERSLPSIIRFISESTLLICGFHLLVFAMIKGVMLYMFGISPATLNENLLYGMLFAVSALMLTLPIAFVVRKYFGFLVDK